MPGQGLAAQARGNAAAQRQEPDAETQVRDAIKRRLPTIKALLPDVLDERKLAALVITEVHKTPALAECDEASLIGCVLRAAALGLQFGQDLGQAFLIPRKNYGRQECTLQIGYKGVVALAMRSGEVKSITTRSVYDGDEFEFEYGLNERLIHRPTRIEERTDAALTHAYCIARYVNGGVDWEVLDRRQIEARRARGKGAQPAWQTDYAKMAEKSAILAMRARLPLTTEVATALAQDGAAITVSSRGPAALEVTHEERPAIEASTGEILREDPPPPPPTTPASPAAPDPAMPQTVDGWKAALKARNMKVADALRMARGINGDEVPNLAALVESDVAGQVWALVAGLDGATPPEVDRDEPASGGPMTGDEPPPADEAAADPEPEQQGAAAPIGSGGGQEVHRELGRLGIPQAVHDAVILRASRGRTTHASQLNPSESHLAIHTFGVDAAGGPVTFAAATLEAWKVESPERAALAAWVAKETGG